MNTSSSVAISTPYPIGTGSAANVSWRMALTSQRLHDPAQLRPEEAEQRPCNELGDSTTLGTPKGFDSWDDYYRDLGVGEQDLGIGEDSIADPLGEGPRIWIQGVPDAKTVKNRLHLDITVGGDRSVPIEARAARVDAEAQRLVGLGATMTRVLTEPGLDHYAVAMIDPESNEFDIN